MAAFLKISGCFLAMLVLSSCALLHSEYATPQTALPEKWQTPSSGDTAVAMSGSWWRSFGDPVLNDLIERALLSNNDLAAATLSVKKARQQAGLTATNLTPSVSLGGAAGYTRNLASGNGQQSYRVTLDSSYELDLWGKLAALRQGDRWESLATAEDRQSTALSLIGTVAAAYWKIAWLNERITAAEESVANGAKTLALVQTRFGAGDVALADLDQAQKTVADRRTELLQLQQQRAEARNALAILFDQAPGGSLPESLKLPEQRLPEVTVGIPAGLLGRRPDLRAAELRLREKLVAVDAARASFYPSFSLTGSLGESSVSLRQVLQNPVAALGVGMTLPFLQWQTMQLKVDLAATEYEEAVVVFRQKLYTALAEVENILSARKSLDLQAEQLQLALEAATRTEAIAGVRYRAGATSLQSLLEEEERRRTAATALAENRLNRLTTMVKLCLALGGGTDASSSGR